MADIKIAAGLQSNGAGDDLALALKLFSGDVLKAFQENSVTDGKTITRTIMHGKSAQFPVFGRTAAHYLKKGKSLDDLRQNIKQIEKVISIDGLLTADALIFDMEEWIAHYDFRSVYAGELGNALAKEHDTGVIAEIIKSALDPENIAGSTTAGEKHDGTGKGGVVALSNALAGAGINADTGKAIYELLLQGKAHFARNFVPTQQRYALVSPEQHAALASQMDFLNREYGAGGTITEGNVLRLAGFDVMECPYIDQGADAGSVAANLMGGAAVHQLPELKKYQPVVMWHPSAVGVVRMKDLTMETGRRIEYQADQIIAKMAEGIGGLRPESAIIGILDTKANITTADATLGGKVIDPVAVAKK